VQDGDYESLLAVFYRLLAITGYFSRCEREGQHEALHNLGVMTQLVAAFDENGGTRNFHQFMAYLKLIAQGGVDPVVVPPEDAVQIMTIHQAKGLEFPVVVLGAAMNGRIPTTRRKARFEIPYAMRASGGLEPGVDDPHLVDERKLFYVAVTHARELLVIGTADVVNKRGQGPSVFLREMFGEDLHAVASLTDAYVEAVESRAGRAAGPKERHSYSQLAYYLQCPVRYKYLVVYAMAVPLREEAPFGANVHRALEQIHVRALAGQPAGDADVEAIVEENWVAGHEAPPERDEALRKAAIEQLQTYVRRHAGTFPQVEAAERRFSFAVSDHILLGKIDLVRREEAGVEIVDFKTSEASPAALEGVTTQLALYALGAESELGRQPSRVSVHFLGDDQRKL
jgi:DNA helicase-2/ATP-dependent DNA helicase PcrA